jgi:hypothetical protein
LSLVKKLTMPELENGQIKDFLGIPAGGNVLREHSFYGALLKISARGCLRIEQKVPDPVPEVLTKPSFIRHWEASLFALENFTRD